MDTEPAGLYCGDNLSFASSTRIRLDHLSFDCDSPMPWCDIDGTYGTNCQQELWDNEPREEQSALDLVELLDVEDDVQDEETWLYESPKTQLFVDKSDGSALKWCRQVLDNPSPEMEVACRALRNALGQRSRTFLSSRSYTHPLVFPETGHTFVGSSGDQRSPCTTRKNFARLDYNEPDVSDDSITLGYRLQDLTDVHIMARIQEDSLRQDYVSIPAATSPRNSESSTLPPTNSTNRKCNADESTPANTPGASSSCLSTSLSSSPCRSPASFDKQSYHSPRLAQFHQQVAQFKMLKLAQNRAAVPQGVRLSDTPPLRTSLRSLQAVRISRSLESSDHCPPVSLRPPAGVSSARAGRSSCSVQTAASRRLQSSQTVSQSSSRIPHPAKSFSGGGCLSGAGRVFATPERSAIVAWGENVPSAARR